MAGVPKTSSSSHAHVPGRDAIRTDRVASASARRLWRSTACWTATAPATASDAPGNTAMMPSPVDFTTRPA